jgi:hypothetical protein
VFWKIIFSNKLDLFKVTCSIMIPFVALLRSFSQLALPARGVSIRILQLLDWARTPPKYHSMCVGWTTDLTVTGLLFRKCKQVLHIIKCILTKKVFYKNVSSEKRRDKISPGTTKCRTNSKKVIFRNITFMLDRSLWLNLLEKIFEMKINSVNLISAS